MILKGDRHIDSRGSFSFINDFVLSQVKRFYSIEQELGVRRAWQGHKLESKWFYVAKGRIRVKLKSIDTKELLGDYELTDTQPAVLSIPKGMYNGFELLEEGSILLVFSDVTLETVQI